MNCLWQVLVNDAPLHDPDDSHAMLEAWRSLNLPIKRPEDCCNSFLLIDSFEPWATLQFVGALSCHHHPLSIPPKKDEAKELVATNISDSSFKFPPQFNVGNVEFSAGMDIKKSFKEHNQQPMSKSRVCLEYFKFSPKIMMNTSQRFRSLACAWSLQTRYKVSSPLLVVFPPPPPSASRTPPSMWWKAWSNEKVS